MLVSLKALSELSKRLWRGQLVESKRSSLFASYPDKITPESVVDESILCE